MHSRPFFYGGLCPQPGSVANPIATTGHTEQNWMKNGSRSIRLAFFRVRSN